MNEELSVEEQRKAAWELESGLPNDVDAYMANCRFGLKDEYMASIQVADTDEGTTGLMFIFDMVSAEGELLGSQGYSVGKGWTPSEDGSEMTHAKRHNVINSTRYGVLQKRVIEDLKVDMPSRGLPSSAKVWDGMGFHWMLEDYETFTGKKGQSLLPTEFVGEKKDIAAVAPAAPVAASEVMDKLVALAVGATGPKAFQLSAMKVAGVSDNDELMAQILDEGPEGFYQKNHPGA